MTKEEESSVALVSLGRIRRGSVSECTSSGDGERIDDRYMSRSYLTGVVHESELRIDTTTDESNRYWH